MPSLCSHDHRLARRARVGQALPLAALLLVAVLLVVGLAIDAGQVLLARRSLQAIVDSGAHAGAQQVDVAYFRTTQQVRLDRAAATAAATAVLQEEAVAEAEVMVEAEGVEVLARTHVPVTLMRLSGRVPERLAIEASAVVVPRATSIR